MIRSLPSSGRLGSSRSSDKWLGKFFASDQAANKVSKLGRATAAERHLVIVLDSFSPAGIGVPLGLQTRREPRGRRIRAALFHAARTAYPLLAAPRLRGDRGRSLLDP